MKRVVRVVSAAASPAAKIVDSLMLNAEQRRVQTARLTASQGTEVGMMLPEPVVLRGGDLLELDDGSFVDIVIEPEALLEVRGSDLTHLARLAWHLGDRHVPIQALPNRLRIRPDAALEEMLRKLGARVTPIEAPFDPEGGAYAHAAHGHHDHGHDHQHDHDHGHAHGHHHHHDHK